MYKRQTQHVIALTALDHVAAGSAEHPVGTRSTPQRVMSARATEEQAAADGGAIDVIGAAAAEQLGQLNVDQRVIAQPGH